ncbi:armadillo-type protein [Aspergillus karnatakaensis]|uniref:putative GTP binding protein n=1 Tax=Aspergillus karnatakaensis TaxID=1810916 RepID=UPI003CCCB441
MSVQHDEVAALNSAHKTLISQNSDYLDCPSLDKLFAEPAQSPPAIESPRAESLPLQEQEDLLHSVGKALKEAELGSNAAVSEDVPSILYKLWHGRSQHLIQAAEALANGSRNSPLRLVYGQNGILNFFLRLVASDEITGNSLILHSLRLIGNSCADTDENRAIVVQDNYTFAILRHLLRPELIKVVIPVIYNLCIDYEPAQTQLAANKIVYILLKLVKHSTFKGNDALLEYAYELIGLVGEQEKGIEGSPDGTLSLLIDLILDKDAELAPAQFCCVLNCLVAYLNNSRFQTICISNLRVADILSVLKKSLSIRAGNSSDESQALAQARLKLNQGLAELADSPLFAQLYPLDSPLSQTLKPWVTSPEDQLQICACIMLGNLARSDEICVAMVRELKIHEELIAVLKTDARGAVLHSALGFLKNLAIASDNRLRLGEAGITPAIARLWAYETVPQVQLAATSIARQLVISSVENISRLMEPATSEEEKEGEEEAESDSEKTYLSLLLALFKKTDSTPIKTEIGRIVASLCRTLVPMSKSSEQEHPSAHSLLISLLTHHDGIALPVGTMVTQTQWPVVRSEGWFALALMASNKDGAKAVIHGLQEIDGFSLIDRTLSAEEPVSDNETEMVQFRKDRDNIIVLVQELSKNQPETADASWTSNLQNLMSSHVSKYIKQSK